MATADELLDAPVEVSADQLLDQGGITSHNADALLDNPQQNTSLTEDIKGSVKKAASAVMMPLRGYEAMGVGAAKMIAGAEPQEALSRAAEATQPGFEPQGTAENVGSFVGGTVPLLAMPAGEVAAGASRAIKLVHAAKVGGLFGAGFSTVESLENHGSITMDDAEHIAKSTVLNAVLGASAEAILGPIFSRIFKGRSKGEVAIPEEPIPVKVPETAKATETTVVDPVAEVKAKNQEDLTQLIDTRDKISQHGEALTPESQQLLGEINKEVNRLTKLDKTYTIKQMVKDIGINLEDQTPAKAEEILTRASKPDFVVAMRSEKGQVVGEPGMIHGMLDNPGGKKIEAGYVDRNTGKFFTREEAAKAINPDAALGDALHSPILKKLQELETLNPEELRTESINVSQAKNEFYRDFEKKHKGKKASELSEMLKKEPVYEELVKKDLKLHELMFNQEASEQQVKKMKDLIPAIQTDRGVIEGKPGQEHDDIIAQNGLDIVTDNVVEGYKRVDDGQFVTRDEILGPSQAPEKGIITEHQRVINRWAEETATAAKDLGYKTSDEALAWAKKSHHHLTNDYQLAFQNKFQSLMKAEPKVVEPITPSKATVSATPIEHGEATGKILKASEMPITPVTPDLDTVVKVIPPTAGANPEVADIIDSARQKTVGRKGKTKVETHVDEKGEHWTTVKEPTHDITYRGKEIPPEYQAEIDKDTAKSGKVAELKVPPQVMKSSPKLPGTEMAPAFIPEYVAGSSNFRLGWYSRAAKQTRTVLEGMGNAGKELAAKIGLVDDAAIIRSNNFLYNFDKFITKIPKGQREKAGMALMDTLEGRQTTFQLPDGLVGQVQKMFGDIADDAKNLDFQIIRSDGTKVPWAERTNYAPRMVKQEFIDGILRGDGVTLGRVKQYFMESKQVATEYQASQKVQALRRRYMERRYGHIERAREFDLPPEFYDRQGFSVIPEYTRAAFHRMEEVRQFGQHDVKIIELFDRIAGEGHDAIMARQIFDRYAGLEVSDEVHQRLIQGVKNLVTGMSIQLPSTLTQLGQVLTPIHRATSPDIGLGLIKAYGRAAKALIRSFTTLGKEEAARAGQGFESIATDYLLDTYGGAKNKPFGKFAETALKLSGFSGEDSFWRRFSAILGRDHIKNELIPRILKNGSNKYAVTELRQLGLNPTIVKMQGGLSDYELNLAAKRFADQTQGTPNVLNLPLWWSSPTGRFATQFHSFSVVIGKENWLLAKNMVKTGNVNRLISMGLGTPLVGAGISFMKEEMLGLKPTDFTGDKQTDNIIRWYLNGTSFGVAADLMISLSKGRNAFISATQIPAFQIGAGLFYDIKAGLLGDTKAIKRVAQKTPVVGRVLFQ